VRKLQLWQRLNLYEVDVQGGQSREKEEMTNEALQRDRDFMICSKFGEWLEHNCSAKLAAGEPISYQELPYPPDQIEDSIARVLKQDDVPEFIKDALKGGSGMLAGRFMNNAKPHPEISVEANVMSENKGQLELPLPNVLESKPSITLNKSVGKSQEKTTETKWNEQLNQVEVQTSVSFFVESFWNIFFAFAIAAVIIGLSGMSWWLGVIIFWSAMLVVLASITSTIFFAMKFFRFYRRGISSWCLAFGLICRVTEIAVDCFLVHFLWGKFY
jgi:hypothetical protein